LVAPDGRLLIAACPSADQAVFKLIDVATGRKLATIPCSGSLGGLFSPDSTRLLTNDGALWDIAARPPRQLGQVDLVGGDAGQFSPDSKWLAIMPYLGKSTHVRFYDARTSAKLDLRLLDFSTLTFSPTGTAIADVTRREPSVWEEWLADWLPTRAHREAYDVLWVQEFPTGREIAALPDAAGFAFFPDGQSIAVGKTDGTIEIWDIPPCRPWWIDYGLPAVFAVLLLLAARLVWRAVRKPREPAPC
jgi:WD40 repeat protein